MSVITHVSVQKWEAHSRRLRAGISQSNADALQVVDFQAFQLGMERLLQSYNDLNISRSLAVITPHLDHIRTFERAISGAAQNNKTASLVWSGAQAVIECACRHSDYMESTLDQLIEFYDSLPLLEQHLDLFPTNLRLQFALQEIYSDYVDFCLCTINYLNHPPLFNTVRNLFSSKPHRELRKAQSQYQRHLQRFKDAADLVFKEHQIRRDDARKNYYQNANLPLTAVEKDVKFPISTVPYHRNKSFHGRGPILQELKRHLQSQRTPGQAEITSCNIHGMPGIGKTQTALQYAFENLAHYDCVFWVAAENNVELLRTFSDIAEALHLRDGRGSNITRAIQWRRETESHNAITDYWPHDVNSQSSVIITSRKADLTHLVENNIDLPSFDSGEGGAFLLKLLTQTNPKRVSEQDELSVATEIADEVGCLPLAIACISGYISQIRKSLQEFLEIFRQRKKFVLEMDSPIAWHGYHKKYNNLATVWDLAFEDLSPQTLRLLNILAFMNGDRIPEALLLSSVCPVPDDQFAEFLRPGNNAEFIELTRRLAERSLVRIEHEPPGTYLVMHRSLRDGVLHRLEKDLAARQLVFDQVVAILRRAIPISLTQSPALHLWPEYQLALPHVMRLQSIFENSHQKFTAGERLAQLLTDTVINMFYQGLTQQVKPLIQSAEKILNDSNYNAIGIQRANVDTITGIINGDQGISERLESTRRRKRALAIRRRQDSVAQVKNRENEILLYNAESDYGCALLQQNLWKAAEPYFERCFAKYPEWGNEDQIPFEYAKYYHHIAFVRLYENKLDDAVAQMKRSIALVERLNPVGTLAFKFRFDLACFETQRDNIDLAFTLHEAVLNDRKKYLGDENTQTLLSYYTTGVMHHMKHNLSDAETNIRTALDLDKKLRLRWPEVFSSRAKYYLSTILVEAKKQLDEADKLREESLEVLNRLLPLDFLPCLRDVDPMLQFDHMIPCFAGRFSGTALLLLLQQTTGKEVADTGSDV